MINYIMYFRIPVCASTTSLKVDSNRKKPHPKQVNTCDAPTVSHIRSALMCKIYSNYVSHLRIIVIILAITIAID